LINIGFLIRIVQGLVLVGKLSKVISRLWFSSNKSRKNNKTNKSRKNNKTNKSNKTNKNNKTNKSRKSSRILMMRLVCKNRMLLKLRKCWRM